MKADTHRGLSQGMNRILVSLAQKRSDVSRVNHAINTAQYANSSSTPRPPPLQLFYKYVFFIFLFVFFVFKRHKNKTLACLNHILNFKKSAHLFEEGRKKKVCLFSCDHLHQIRWDHVCQVSPVSAQEEEDVFSMCLFTQRERNVGYRVTEVRQWVN